jgi:penicillin-binding protein 1C
VAVCLATGYRATEHCPDTVVTAAPAGAPPLAPCPYHETIYVTADGKHRVDSRCWEPDSVRSESVLLLPPEVAGHIRSAGLEASRVPPWLPDCAPDPSTSTLAVTYPTEGARIFLPRELDGSLQRLTVRAAHQNPDASLYWYLDTRYVGRTTHPHKVSVALERGSYTITCVDDAGARASVSFVVDVDTGG